MLLLVIFFLCGASVAEALSHPPSSRWTTRRVAQPSQKKNVCVGERARVVVNGGAARKACKKQRRSRSPQLWPATVSRTGEKCWLRLSPSQSFLAVENDTVLGVVVEAEGDHVVVAAASGNGVASKRLPDDARLLDSLKTGDPLNVTVVRILQSPSRGTNGGGALLVSCKDVYRRAKTGAHRRLRVVLRVGKEHESARVGSTLTAFVERAQPNSGTLTLSKDPVIKPDRALARIRRQIDRGSLHPGSQRIATVVKLAEDNNTAHVDAGGLRASVDLSSLVRSGVVVSECDRITVRVLSISAETGEAT